MATCTDCDVKHALENRNMYDDRVHLLSSIASAISGRSSSQASIVVSVVREMDTSHALWSTVMNREPRIRGRFGSNAKVAMA